MRESEGDVTWGNSGGSPPGSSYLFSPLLAAAALAGMVLYLWDQVDFLTTTWPLLLFWVRPGWDLVLASFVMAPAAHQLVTLTGFLIGARRRAIQSSAAVSQRSAA